MRHDNQNDPNDPLPFITIGTAMQNVMRYLELAKEAEKDRTQERECDGKHEQKDKAHSDYIAERVREIERFERRAAGLEHRARRKRE